MTASEDNASRTPEELSGHPIKYVWERADGNAADKLYLYLKSGATITIRRDAATVHFGEDFLRISGSRTNDGGSAGLWMPTTYVPRSSIEYFKILESC